MNPSITARLAILADTARILATPRRVTPTPAPAPRPAKPVVEVSETEAQMLRRSAEIFAGSPLLQATYRSAEAFGRACLRPQAPAAPTLAQRCESLFHAVPELRETYPTAAAFIQRCEQSNQPEGRRS